MLIQSKGGKVGGDSPDPANFFTPYDQQQVFTPLGETAAGHTESYNIYGVVIDAICPYIKNKPTCQVRLVDQSLNLKAAGLTGTSATTYASCQVFANESNKLPLVLHIGDIIRFNRVNVAVYRD